MGFKVIIKKIHSKAGIYYKTNNISYYSCGTFFKVTYIDVEGNIQICSNDINGIHSLGNINNTSFPELKKIKKNYIGKENPFEICKFCDDEYRFINLNE